MKKFWGRQRLKTTIPTLSVFQNENRNNPTEDHNLRQPHGFRFERKIRGLLFGLTKQ